MTRFAKYRKEKKPIGDDGTPWEEMKKGLDDKAQRQEAKRAEKKLKKQLKQVNKLFST